MLFRSAIAVNQGILQADTGGLNGSSTTNGISFGGGTLAALTTAGITTNKAISASSTILLDTTNGAINLGGNIATTASGLTVSGANFLTLGGANSYSGLTTIGTGGVKISAANNLGNGSTTNTISLGGNLNSTAGTYDLGVNRSIALTASGTIQVDAGALTVSGAISGANTLTKSGAGTLVLSGTNSYTGATIVNGGTLKVVNWANSSNDSSIGNTGTAASNLIINGGTVVHDAANVAATNRRFQIGPNGATIDSSATSATNSLSFTNTGSLNATTSGVNRTLTLTGSNTGSNALASIIVDPTSAATSLSKTGTGMWIVSGNNTYTGTTDVNNGNLRLNGTNTSTALVTVAAGATLGGSGSIGGQINVSGVLAPGNSIESFGSGSLNFIAGSTYAYEIDATATVGLQGDLAYSSGTLDIATGTNLTLTELASGIWSSGAKLTLISYFSDGSTSGWNDGLFTYGSSVIADDSSITIGSQIWTFNYNDLTGGNNYVSDQTGNRFVTITAIPEPDVAMLFGGLGLLALVRRRRVR